MFLFLDWEKMGWGQGSRRLRGPKSARGLPVTPSSAGPDLVLPATFIVLILRFLETVHLTKYAVAACAVVCKYYMHLVR